MDETDLQILRELMMDARKPFSKIAKKIGISTQTVIKRYNEMRDKNIIETCSISINLRKIGYKGTAHLLIMTSSNSSLTSAVEQLKGIQNIVIASKAIGDFEGYAVLFFRDVEELHQTVLQIRKMPSISKVEVSFAIPGLQNFPPIINPIPELRPS